MNNLALAAELVQVGEYPVDPTLPLADLAATTVVCNTILSFDETLVKR